MTIDDYEAGGHASVHGASRRDGIDFALTPTLPGIER